MKISKLYFGLLLIASCQTAADSNYELNRRSGLSLGQDTKDQKYNVKTPLKSKKLSLSKRPIASQNTPRLTAPTVEKVWVSSQQISENTWLQGTWVYVQTEKPKWVSPAKKRSKK